MRSNAVKQIISVETLAKTLTYHPETGVFTANQRTARLPAGRVVGAPSPDLKPDSYLMVCVDGGQVSAHHAAYALMTGHWLDPELVIDHINGIPKDNRWVNLRPCTQAENLLYGRMNRAQGPVLPVGITPNLDGRWKAADANSKYIGIFPDIASALEAQAAVANGTFDPGVKVRKPYTRKSL